LKLSRPSRNGPKVTVEDSELNVSGNTTRLMVAQESSFEKDKTISVASSADVGFNVNVNKL